MFKFLLNAYLVLAVFLLGPEAVAKSLPMKKVKTVETVWVPVEAEEVEELQQGIEAVEINEAHEGAVPLFKEAVVPAEATEPEVVQIKDLPKVLVQKPKQGAVDKRPIIQVIYQNQPEGTPPQVIPIPAKPEKKPKVNKPEKAVPKEKGDIYNFYFRA